MKATGAVHQSQEYSPDPTRLDWLQIEARSFSDERTLAAIMSVIRHGGIIIIEPNVGDVIVSKLTNEDQTKKRRGTDGEN